MFFSQVRIAEVHVYFRAGRREIFRRHRGLFRCLRLFDEVFNQAVIDDTVRRIHRNHRAVLNGFRGGVTATLRTDDTRNAQFAADDRRVAGHAARIGNNRFCFLHGRNPVGSGHFRDQNFAFVERINQRRVQDDVRFTADASRAGR